MADIIVGSAAVEIVPSMRTFASRIRAEVEPLANRIGKDIGDTIERKIAESIKKGIAEGYVGAGSESSAAGRKSGDQFGGAFAKSARTRVEAALKALPPANVRINSREAELELRYLREEMQTLLNKEIGIDISDKEAIAQIDDFKLRIDALAAKSPSVQIKVDTLAASAQLLAFRAELAALDGTSAGSNAGKGFSGIAASIGEAAAATGPLALGISAVGAALVPVVASAAGLAAALVLPLAAAGGGLGLGAILAGAAVKHLLTTSKQIDALKKKAATLTDPKAAAAARAQAKALEDSLTGPQRAFLAAKDNIAKAFKTLTTGKTGDALFAPIVGGMNLLAKIMPALSPVIISVSKALTGLLEGLAKSASGKGFTDFIAGFAKLAGSTITTAGKSIGLFGTGLFNIFKQFLPLSASVGGGLTKLGQQFVAFSTKASTKQGIADFIGYVKREGPGVLAFFGQLVVAIVTMGKALAPIGSFLLKTFTATFKGLSVFFSGIDKNSAAVGRQFATIGAAFRNVYNASIGPAFKYILAGVGTVIQGFGKLFDVIGKVPGSKFQWARDAAKNLHDAGEATKALGDKLGHIPKPTVKLSTAQVQAAGRTIKSVLDKINILHPKPKVTADVAAAKKAIQAVKDLLSSLHSKTVTVTTHNVHTGPKVTAIGGVFSGAQTRIIAEAGPEAVVPLNRPLAQVDPSVRWLSAIAQGLSDTGATSARVTNTATAPAPIASFGSDLKMKIVNYDVMNGHIDLRVADGIDAAAGYAQVVGGMSR